MNRDDNSSIEFDGRRPEEVGSPLLISGIDSEERRVTWDMDFSFRGLRAKRVGILRR